MREIQAPGERNSALDRFRVQINWVSKSVAKTFSGEIDLDTVRQEAALLVFSYEGAVASGWHNGKLADWERLAKGSEKQIKALLARTLRLDLSRLIGRQVEAGRRAISLDEIPPGEEPSFEDFEDDTIDQIESGTRLLRERYPTLVKHYIDGYGVQQVADAEGISRQAIWRRMKREKTALASARGLLILTRAGVTGLFALRTGKLEGSRQ